MTRTLCILTTAMTALLLAGPGSALHCNGDITTIATSLTSFYIDDRSDEAGEFNHWTYMESNGVDGLQSGNQNTDYPHIDLIDPCAHEDPDLLLF